MSISDFDPHLHQGALPSPCISICQMNRASGLCEGCLRTIDEITRWSTATEDDKRTVWIDIKRRQEAMFDDAGKNTAANAAPP